MDLHTERLRLRELRPDDAAVVHAYSSDPEVIRYVPFGPLTRADAERFVASMIAAAGETPRSLFTLGVDLAGALIGTMTLRVTDAENGHGEMGYVLARVHWGHGYATEMAAAMLRFGFDELGLRRVTAFSDPENTASMKVLTKLGMRRERLLRSYLEIRGERRDRVLFAAVNPTTR